MNESIPQDFRSWMVNTEARLKRIEGALGINEIGDATLTKVKALIKNGSNAYFNGVRVNPHPPGTQENELWQYGSDLAHDVSGGL